MGVPQNGSAKIVSFQSLTLYTWNFQSGKHEKKIKSDKIWGVPKFGIPWNKAAKILNF